MILVSLCFVAVLGIMLAGYLAVCSRVMNLSNRGLQADLSKQLAEAGIDEALRAFNKNDWSDWTSAGIDVNWSVDTSNKRATATISYPANKFGQGVSATLKVRVDNYDARVLGAVWSSAKTYRIGDIVGYNGIWYSCVRDHSNQAPSANNFTNWVPTPVPWKWDSARTYSVEELVNHGGTWYRCLTSNSNQAPPNANWQAIPTVYFQPSIDYTNEAILYWGGGWWRYNAGSWDSAPAISWRYRSGKLYYFNDLVYYGGVWYRFINATPTASVTPGSNALFWENALSGGVHGWLSGSVRYNLGDTVYYSTTGQWYRCILAHTSSAAIPPSNTSYWTNTPLLSNRWKNGTYYTANDVVSHNGVWFLCILSHTSSASITPAHASYWVGANTTSSSYRWNSTTAYTAGAYRVYGGAWYRCLVANTGQSPNNTTYWTSAWSQSSGVTTGTPIVYAEATVTLGDNTTSRTQLRAPLDPAPLFPNAAAANASTITANSGGTVDSYDSTSGTPSATQYSSQVGTTTNFSAILASAYSAGTAITLSSTTVKGYIAAPSSTTAPYAPLFSSGGTVKGYTSAPSPNIDLNQVSRSPYIPVFDTQPGGAGGLATNWNTTHKGTALGLSSTTNIGTPGAAVSSRFFHNGTLTIGGSSIQYLNINGPVILYINGNLNITNSSSIGRININSNGSAEIHVAGRFMADAGGQGIQSYTYDPKSLVVISDTTSASSHFYSEGVNPFYGVIYIPYSTSNSGYYNDNNSTNIYGAVSANKITYSGANMNIHYDTSLRYATFGGVDQPYTVTQWRELDAAEWATMP